MWIQMGGAPTHFGIVIRNFINNNYPQWIGRRGLLDFYFWGYMKYLVYAQILNSRA